MRYSVAVCEPASESYPAPLQGSIPEAIRWAGRLGFDGVELHLRSPEQVEASELLRTCAETGVAVAAISTGMGHSVDGLSLIDEDPERREAAVLRLVGHIDLAAELGCAVIIGLMRGLIPQGARPEEHLDRFAAGVRRLLDHAEGGQVTVLIEAINRFQANYLLNVPETLRFIQRFEHPLLKLHIDTFHMNIEDGDMVAAIRGSGDHLGYVHYSENHRGTPGTGQIDFRLLTRTLLSVGYGGFVGLEFIPEGDPGQCAGVCLRYLRSIEEVAGKAQ